MGFYNNNVLLLLLCLLITLLINHMCMCKASDEFLCIPSERQALLHLKYHLVDPSNRLASWSENTNCCNWTSVVCNNVSGHIFQLHLQTSRLDYVEYETFERPQFGGEIDPSILALKQLSYLDLSGNDFGNMQIPSFFGSMKSLTYLNLSYAGFNGTIPHQIGNLSNLLYLDLRGNDFTGTIPHQIGNLSSLLHLDLGGNDFTGKIPHQVGNLSKLLYLSLSGGYQYDDMGAMSMYVENLQWMSSLSSLHYLKLVTVNLSDSFAWFHVLQSLPSLTELHLQWCSFPHHFHPGISVNFSSLTVLDLSDSNDLSSSLTSKWISQLKNLVSLQLSYLYMQGSVPNGIQNLTLLEDLDLSYNFFNSSIPNWLYALTHLKSLSLSSNKFHGPITHGIGNLTSMITLDLSSNYQLEGPIPSSLRSLCNLKRVDLSSIKLNQQVSEITEIISNCSSQTLHVLFISGAQLSGHLTPRIGTLKNLIDLDLSYNSIQGAIPISLGNLSSLNQLDLSRNSIQGALPISLGNLTSLNRLYLFRNQFNGNPFDVIKSLSALQSLYISDNLFQGEVTEDHLANFTKLYAFIAEGNKLILKVGPNWSPSFQKLEALYMASWNLGPRFPSWMQSLKYLEYFSIANTSISDSLPTWVWDAFPYSVYFDFSNNNIHGDLSHTLNTRFNVSFIDLSSNHLSGHLPLISPQVYSLDLSSNWFSGSIASFLCQKRKEPMGLEYLNLASNILSGEIPDCWKMWSNLKIIKFDSNHFRGNLPASMGSLPWLNSLQLRNNTLSGVFPACLKNNTKLVLLDLRENQFSGIIPPFVGDILLNLKAMLLRSNRFVGKIPDQICSLAPLQILDLAHNNLTGQMPKCIYHLRDMQVENNHLNVSMWSEGNHSSYTIRDVLLGLKGREDIYSSLGLITSIDLSDNKLSGEIPTEITSLKSLLFLNLSNNLLSGKIPQGIGTMASLESMDFSNNQLCGEIPLSMSNLSFLCMLNLSHNDLRGKIPTGTQLQSFEPSSFEGNHLCGPPLLNDCNDLHNVPKNEHNAKEGKGEINWFYVNMSLGFVSGFWAVVGPLLYNRSWRYTYFCFLDRMWYKLQSFWC